MEQFLRYNQIYDKMLPLPKIWETSYLDIGHTLGRPLGHTHHKSINL